MLPHEHLTGEVNPKPHITIKARVVAAHQAETQGEPSNLTGARTTQIKNLVTLIPQGNPREAFKVELSEEEAMELLAGTNVMLTITKEGA